MMMDPTTVVFMMIGALIVLIVLGVHIGLALGSAAIVGTYLVFGSWELAVAQVGSAAFFVLRDYVFAVIPLFVLMGEFVSKSGSARDLYRVMNHALKRIPGRLAVATVGGNAIFAAVTGTSLASAAAFSRLAYPEMTSNGYSKRYALGAVAGSACLGMLIPPSVLMIIWGIVAEISIGRLFIAGILPGLALALMFAVYCSGAAILRPEIAPKADVDVKIGIREQISGLGVVALIALVLGGLYGGFFTPTESAAVGAIGGLALALIKGVGWTGIREAIVESGKTIAPILFLLLTAQMYMRLLTTGGVVNLMQDTIAAAGFEPFMVVVVMIVIWLVLGMLLDSASIILLTVPIFWPIAQGMGFDPFAFAILGILAIEAGLLTPPVGLLAYAVKAAVPDRTVTLAQVFGGAMPYWIMILILMAIVWIFPELATALMPN